MKKFLKITGITLLVLILALIATPFLFKGKIISLVREEANKKLNATVNFSDDIGISIFKSFPKLTVTMSQVSIIGKDTFRGDTLVYLPDVSVSLNVMSVIKGDKMEINRISLKQPYINVLVLENGQANYDITIPDTAVSTPEDTSASSFRMALEKLEIQDGRLVYEDRSLPFYTALEHFDHDLKGDFTQDNFLLETVTKAQAFTMGYGGVNYLEDIKTEIKANLDMDMKNMKFTFKDNDILLNELNIGGEGFVDMNENDMDFDVAFRTKKTDFKTFLSLVPGIYSKSFDKAKASGKLALSGYMKGKMTDDKMPGFGVKLDIDNGFFQYPDLPKSLNNVFVNLEVDNKTGDPDNTLINLQRFEAKIAGEPVMARLMVKTPVSNPYVDGALKGNVNLGEFRSFIPMEKTTEISGLIKSDLAFKGFVNALQNQQFDKFSASGTIAAQNFHFKDPDMLKQGTDLNAEMSFSPTTVELKQLKGTAGMSDFDAMGRIDNLFGYMLKDELLKGQFTFNSNYFNANEFLSDETVTKEPTAADSVPMQAFEVPANLDFALNSRINTLIYDNLKMQNLAGTILIKNQELYFDKVGLDIFGGSLGLNGLYDSKNPKFPLGKMDFTVKALDITQTFNHFDMVKKLVPVAQYTQGLFNANINLANNFNQDMSVSYPTVNAGIQLGIADAAIKNLPILNMIADKLKIDKLKNLSLKNLNLKLNVLNGKVGLDSLLLPLWTGAKARISGFYGLDQSLQYVAKLSIPRKDFGAANTALNSLTAQAQQKGINLDLSEMIDVDVIIGGFFSKPDIKVSLHDVKNKLFDNLKQQALDQLEQKKQAAIDEAKRRAEAAKAKTLDSLNKLKQQGIDKINAEKKAAEEKIAEERRKAEEKVKAEEERIKQEAAKKAEEEKQKALDKLKKKGLEGLKK
jgi:hypothetical protein